MDPLLPADTELMDREADKDARRKIQFSVPSSVPPQLDPRQVEMIRRRRPTPATLFRLTDPPSPDDDTSPHQWMLAENGALKSKLVNTMTYQPPSLKVVQKMAQAHLSSLLSVDKDDSSSEDEEEKKEKEGYQTDSSKDVSEEIKPFRDEPALPDGLKGNANLSHRHRAEEEAKEREEEEKGE